MIRALDKGANYRTPKNSLELAPGSRNPSRRMADVMAQAAGVNMTYIFTHSVAANLARMIRACDEDALDAMGHCVMRFPGYEEFIKGLSTMEPHSCMLDVAFAIACALLLQAEVRVHVDRSKAAGGQPHQQPQLQGGGEAAAAGAGAGAAAAAEQGGVVDLTGEDDESYLTVCVVRPAVVKEVIHIRFNQGSDRGYEQLVSKAGAAPAPARHPMLLLMGADSTPRPTVKGFVTCAFQMASALVRSEKQLKMGRLELWSKMDDWLKPLMVDLPVPVSILKGVYGPALSATEQLIYHKTGRATWLANIKACADQLERMARRAPLPVTVNDVAEKEQEIARLRRQLEQERGQAAQLRQQLEDRDQAIIQLGHEAGGRLLETAQLRQQLAGRDQAIIQLGQARGQAVAQMEQARGQAAQLLPQLEEREREISRLRQEAEEREREIAQLRQAGAAVAAALQAFQPLLPLPPPPQQQP